MRNEFFRLDQISDAFHIGGFVGAIRLMNEESTAGGMDQVDLLVQACLRDEGKLIDRRASIAVDSVSLLFSNFTITNVVAFLLLLFTWRVARVEISEREQATLATREAHDVVQRANVSKNRILAILSHELRTPLTPVLMTVTALQDRNEYPELQPTLEMIRRNVETEARLIDDLLDIALIEAGRLQLRREPIDAHVEILRAIEHCRAEIEGFGLELVERFDASRHFLRADATRLQQIVWNLVRNAAKFTPEGGSITIRTFDREAEAGTWQFVLSVQDSGIGLTGEDLAMIFKTFEQIELPSGTRSGLGLGLVIARSLAEAHRGELSANSPGRNQGSTFTLTLPDARSNSLALRSPVPSKTSSKGLRVLLVEDNLDTLSSLTLILQSMGVEVRSASGYADALALVANWRFDLLFSDIQLPDGSGLDLMRHFGPLGIVGLAMSGFGSEEDIVSSRDAGFAEHLTKPLTLAMIEAALTRVLSLGTWSRPVRSSRPILSRLPRSQPAEIHLNGNGNDSRPFG